MRRGRGEYAQVTSGGKGTLPCRYFGPRAEGEEFVQVLCTETDLVVLKEAEDTPAVVSDDEDRSSIRYYVI